jgi:hypothetical protein
VHFSNEVTLNPTFRNKRNLVSTGSECDSSKMDTHSSSISELYRHALEEGISFSEAWNKDVRERREEARREQSFSDSSGKDIAEYEEDQGYHREHGEWGKLFDQDGNQIYEDLSRGSDGCLYNDDGVRVEKSERDDDSAENDDY